MIKSVTVKVIDHKNSYIRPPRTVEIETEHGKFMTPTRAATRHEYLQKAKLPTVSPIDNAFSSNVITLEKNDFSKFMTDNTYFETILRKVQNKAVVERYSTFLFEFYLTSSGKSPSLPIVQDPNVREGFLKRIIDIHRRKSIQNLIIPYLNIPLSDYIQELNQLKVACDKFNLTMIPQVDLTYKQFKPLLDHCIKNLNLNAISLIYRAYDKTAQSYQAVWGYNEQDVAFFVSHIPRSLSTMEDLSGVHYMPFSVGDIFALIEYPPHHFPKQNDTDLAKLKFFDRKDCDLKSIKQLLPVFNTFKDTIKKEIDSDNSLDNVIDNIQEAGSNVEKYNVVKALTLTHELKASTLEFTVLRSNIKSQDSVEYVRSKPKLKPIVNKSLRLNNYF